MATFRVTHLAGAVAAVVVSIAPFLWAAGFAGGTGEPNDPYQIATAEQLASIGSDPNLLDKHFMLLADIDLDPNLPGGRVFAQAVIAADVLGQQGTNISLGPSYFVGSLDGNGHVVKNLVIETAAACSVGLFGTIGAGGRVWNLGVRDALIQGLGNVGGLAGTNSGTITGCFATGRVWSGDGVQDVGGLVGLNDYFGYIADCYSRSDVSGGKGSCCLGGFAGCNSFLGSIINCYAAGNISGGPNSLDCGRFVGRNQTVARERGPSLVAGTIGNCYFLQPPDAAPDTQGGLPLTDEQMKKQGSFVGWDFEDVWSICESKDYPRLRWEQVRCRP